MAEPRQGRPRARAAVDSSRLDELKCGKDLNALGPCVWDAAKLAFALQCRKGAAAYLLAAAPRDEWERPARGSEFFADHAHDMGLLRVLYGDWWRQWEACGDPQPSELPACFATTQVHSADFKVGGTDWRLRLGQVVVADERRLKWPRMLQTTEGEC